MKWIDVKEMLPPTQWKIVLFTDGILMGIGYYVANPQEHGCLENIEECEEKCGIECPHWHKVQESNSFVDQQECFGYLDPTSVTHWMELPKIPY